jgi:hypothetical protein
MIMARDNISPEVNVKGFKKCFTSNAMCGTEDDLLWNGTEEDGNARSWCEEDEGNDDKMETVTLIDKRDRM